MPLEVGTYRSASAATSNVKGSCPTDLPCHGSTMYPTIGLPTTPLTWQDWQAAFLKGPLVPLHDQRAQGPSSVPLFQVYSRLWPMGDQIRSRLGALGWVEMDRDLTVGRLLCR